MRAIVAALTLVVAPGCFWATTKHEGEVMRENIKNIDARLKTQEQVLEGRVKQLDESIDKATKILARNSADLGTQVDTFSTELAQFKGDLGALNRNMEQVKVDVAQLKTQQTELSSRLDNIERQLGIQPAVAGQPTSMPVDKNAIYDGAVAKLQAGKYADARRELRLFIQAFADDERADNAAFFVGESFVKEKDYERAIAEFQRVIDSWPKGDLVDDAFLAAGQAALSAKLCIEAGAYFGELVRRFPQSPLAGQAKSKLAYVKKSQRNEKICRKP